MSQLWKVFLGQDTRKEVRKKAVRDTSTTVRGILIPVDWDEHGKALAVVVSTPGENDYLIEQDSMGKEMLGLIRQEVEVTGVVGTGTKDRKTITVKSYALKEWLRDEVDENQRVGIARFHRPDPQKRTLDQGGTNLQ